MSLVMSISITMITMKVRVLEQAEATKEGTLGDEPRIPY
jgi:hypothetical protein